MESRPDANDSDRAEGSGPEDLRRGFAAYVAALHEAYLDAVGGPEAAAAAELPLGREPFTVAIVGGPGMHVLATRDPLPAEQAHEQPLHGELGPLHWTVRFFDPTVVERLADLVPAGVEPSSHVRDVLGLTTTLYHLVLGPDSALSPHHAMHAGSGLAGAHLAET